jgi:hypothetical protein
MDLHDLKFNVIINRNDNHRYHEIFFLLFIYYQTKNLNQSSKML